VKLRDAIFLMRALTRTQRMMDPEHYLSEYALAAPAESVVRLTSIPNAQFPAPVPNRQLSTPKLPI